MTTPQFPPFRDPEPGDLFCLSGQHYYVAVAEPLLIVRDGDRAIGWTVRAEDGSMWKLIRRDDSLDGCRFSGHPLDAAARAVVERARAAHEARGG